MKPTIFALTVVGALSGLAGSAYAQDYPWCATYSGRAGGAQNCGFSTFEQCQATVSGIGGFCDRNTQYHPQTSHRRYQ
jgi:hypothetical protein